MGLVEDNKISRQISLIAVAVIFTWLFPLIKSQFISHIDQKGLRGNLTFNVKGEANESVLIVEAFLEEVDQSRWIQGHRDEEEFDTTQAILFDWSLHTTVLEPHMITSCSNDNLGPKVANELQHSLASTRPIVLNKLNQWTLQLDEFLQNNSANSLSSLIWGKSIKLKLSSVHAGKTASLQTTSGDGEDQQSQPLQPPKIQQSPKESPKPPPRVLSVVSRPQLAFSSTPSPPVGLSAQNRPTFAPRPKPTLTRSKPSPVPILPKPEALTFDRDSSESSASGELASFSTTSMPQLSTTSTLSSTNTTTTTSTASVAPTKSRDAIIEATHRRISKLYGNLIICGNIIETRSVKTVEAVFESQIGGRVTIRGNEDDTTLLMLNLYHIRSKVTTRHDWVIMVSDILDHRREDEKCKYLQSVFDPNNIQEDLGCKRNETNRCRLGDLTKKHGQVQVAGQGRRSRTTLVDLNLPLSALEGSRSLFLVIYEVSAKLSNNGLQTRPLAIMSCAPIKTVSSRRVEASFNMDGVRGFVRISQRHSSEPAQINYDLFGLEGNTKQMSIRELPLPTLRYKPDNLKLCTSLGPLFNPTKVTTSNSGVGDNGSLQTTHDKIPNGNLSAKHGHLQVIDSEYEDHYMGEFTDLTLQLYGSSSIVSRSLLIHKNNGDAWACATLQYIDKPVSLAVANFFYPVVGQISFQQPTNEQYAETSVLVEVYNPNAEKSNSIPEHNWMIHLKPALADFYNWSSRCESSGEVYDPILASIGLSNEVYARQCLSGLVNEPLRCRTGDTSLKSGFKLSLPTNPTNRSRYFYTDLNLPLHGQSSIIGRSIVIYDDNAPVQRGNRLACSNIKLVHPLKAQVKSWDSGPSIPSAIRGSVLFEQDSDSKQTRIKLELGGFNGNVEHYAIHEVWTSDDREFPCSNDSLYDIYDYSKVYDGDHGQSKLPPPSTHYGHLSATVDRIKVGDMSRKHGTFEGLQSVQKSYTDSNLPLFAPNSIIGRSMVLRAAVNDFRWVCGNIEPDYDKSSTRELVGLASFDNPRSKISGFVRLTQLEHKDGSLSDTFIQVDLRNRALSPEGYDLSLGYSSLSSSSSSTTSIELKTSEGHNWAVFVNQVGEDAFIAADEVRCIAAGFKWNPYLAQDTLETYPASTCTPSEQFGCAMGDLGLRHGLLTLGPNNRRTLSDSNLPLVGNYSVMGRSLVIFDNKRPQIKLACANIFPDIHLKSNVVIRRSPSFTVARFVDQMRSLLGASDWLLVPELRATKPVANGECVQMTIHFYGQRAHQMQVELNNLITLGTVRKAGRSGVEKISTHYKLCRAGQAQLTSGSRGLQNSETLGHLRQGFILVCVALFHLGFERSGAQLAH